MGDSRTDNDPTPLIKDIKDIKEGDAGDGEDPNGWRIQDLVVPPSPLATAATVTSASEGAKEEGTFAAEAPSHNLLHPDAYTPTLTV